jgi:hypothetical protein
MARLAGPSTYMKYYRIMSIANKTLKKADPIGLDRFMVYRDERPYTHKPMTQVAIFFLACYQKIRRGSRPDPDDLHLD